MKLDPIVIKLNKSENKENIVSGLIQNMKQVLDTYKNEPAPLGEGVFIININPANFNGKKVLNFYKDSSVYRKNIIEEYVDEALKIGAVGYCIDNFHINFIFNLK